MREGERNNVARADLLFGFGCSLAEWLDEGQVLVSGELEDAKKTNAKCHEMLVWMNLA